MAENLRTTRFANGDEIPLIGTDSNTEWSTTTNPARTVFRGNTIHAETFGLLYNHYAVSDSRGICPEGWSVPGESEWMALEALAGMPNELLDRGATSDTEWGGAEANVAGKLKSTQSIHWNSPNEGATDEFGFNWTGGSVRYSYGGFENAASLTIFGSIWSADEADTESAYRRLARFNRSDIRRSSTNKRNGLSVRCVSDTPVSNETETLVPSTIKLEQNFPNPFNPSTQISFELPSAGVVKLALYDVLGRELAVLIDNKNMSAGAHQVLFNAAAFSSGVYIYRLDMGGFTISKRMTLVK